MSQRYAGAIERRVGNDRATMALATCRAIFLQAHFSNSGSERSADLAGILCNRPERAITAEASLRIGAKMLAWDGYRVDRIV